MLKKLPDSSILRFLLVGVLNTLVGAGLMFLLYNLAGCSYWISSAANYVAGGILSYFLNKYFTFRSRGFSWRQVGKFVLTVGICYALAYGAAKPLTLRLLSSWPKKLQENAAMLVGMGFYTVLNYVGQRFFAFRRKEEKEP